MLTLKDAGPGFGDVVNGMARALSDPAKGLTPVSCSGLPLFIRAPNFPSELEGISSADCV